MTNRKTLSCRNNTYIFKLKNTKNIYFRDVGKNKLIFFHVYYIWKCLKSQWGLVHGDR